jgi:hypothetical protein
MARFIEQNYVSYLFTSVEYSDRLSSEARFV